MSIIHKKHAGNQTKETSYMLSFFLSLSHTLWNLHIWLFLCGYWHTTQSNYYFFTHSNNKSLGENGFFLEIDCMFKETQCGTNGKHLLIHFLDYDYQNNQIPQQGGITRTLDLTKAWVGKLFLERARQKIF